MMTEQQKMVALLKMGKPVMKDAMVGLDGPSRPLSRPMPSPIGLSLSAPEFYIGDSVLGDAIDSASAEEQAQIDAQNRAMRRLAVYEQHGTDVAHIIAERADKMRSGPIIGQYGSSLIFKSPYALLRQAEELPISETDISPGAGASSSVDPANLPPISDTELSPAKKPHQDPESEHEPGTRGRPKGSKKSINFVDMPIGLF